MSDGQDSCGDSACKFLTLYRRWDLVLVLERSLDGVGFPVNDVQQHPGRPFRLAAALLPVPQSRRVDAKLSGKFSLRHPKPSPDFSHIHGSGHLHQVDPYLAVSALGIGNCVLETLDDFGTY